MDDRATLAAQLQTVQAERRDARQQRYVRSKLDRFRAELMALSAEGASTRDLAFWLAKYKRLKAHPTTIGKRLSLWRQQGAC